MFDDETHKHHKTKQSRLIYKQDCAALSKILRIFDFFINQVINHIFSIIDDLITHSINRNRADVRGLGKYLKLKLIFALVTSLSSFTR